MTDLPIAVEIEIAIRENEEAQRMIDHGKKTILGYFPPVRAYLHRKQLVVDVRRIKLEAAKKYLADTKHES